MRIAILQLYSGQSGQKGFYNNQLLGLAKAYAKVGHEVFVVFPNKEISSVQTELYEDNIELLYVPAKTFGVHSFYNLEFLLKYRIDLVHLNSDNQAFAPGVIKFCKKNHICQYNYVGTLYSDSENKLKQFLMNFFSKRNIRQYKKTKTFVKTEFVLNQMETQGVKNAKVVPVGLDVDVIPEIIDTKEACRNYLGLPADKKILLFVGRMAEYKKPLDALEVLESLSEEYILIMIGNGELKEAFLKKVKSTNLESRVIYIESIPNVEIHKYYKAADCFINFNTQEIFGMSILEALYQECPVVARLAPGPNTIIEDGKNGFLCDNLAAMCEKISKIDSDMGRRGKKCVEERFSWEAASRIFLEDYK